MSKNRNKNRNYSMEFEKEPLVEDISSSNEPIHEHYDEEINIETVAEVVEEAEVKKPEIPKASCFDMEENELKHQIVTNTLLPKIYGNYRYMNITNIISTGHITTLDVNYNGNNVKIKIIKNNGKYIYSVV